MLFLSILHQNKTFLCILNPETALEGENQKDLKKLIEVFLQIPDNGIVVSTDSAVLAS